MPSDKKSTRSTNNNTSADKKISIGGDVVDSVVISGDNNTVNKTTITQKFFNIFKSDSETLEHRNRRILLGHVENAWIKGVLDASLHGAALLDLGIKQDPEAVTKYPWAIKKESTDETLPAGTSMLEIFDSIGMGRSLLILGAPGSGKTTMLLELARQLIARAREDVTQPIPMVFNLASWTEKLSLADWLAQELNNLYSVPRKTAPDWVKGDKLLLLLDGLDEVRQESRAKCVEAINAFRKAHGLTSLAVCSRSQDYADLNTKLSFEGAVEVRPLTQEHITAFFNRFGDELAGIKHVLEKDSALREIAETPLFLSIMIMAYRDKMEVDILVSGDDKARRKHLFNTYIERMFERPHLKNVRFTKGNILHWMFWVAQKMIDHNQSPYLIENMQADWLNQKWSRLYKIIVGLFTGLVSMSLISIIALVSVFPVSAPELNGLSIITFITIFVVGSLFGIPFLIIGGGLGAFFGGKTIKMVEIVKWEWDSRLRKSIMIGAGVLLLFSLLFNIPSGTYTTRSLLVNFIVTLLLGGLIIIPTSMLFGGFRAASVNQPTHPGDGIASSLKYSFWAFLAITLSIGLLVTLLYVLIFILMKVQSFTFPSLAIGMLLGSLIGLPGGFVFGGFSVVQHYALRFILARNNLLPWRLVPFLDHCVDLIFLRRVGGGYIFVHRLLMEHFAEMYVETPTSKGN